MKLKATITATINTKGNSDPSEDAERVVEKLADLCSEWLQGTAAPQIKIQYTLPQDEQFIKKVDIN
jgi:hypothetical protein